ncbi:hypothetical protein GCM10009850_080750 [Nonomuraea monospora]|uniref:Serine aminopeptidase S33 domain-containing protein n=1 Tax=Nonomuraea monospora TaxID=568818 RepID=A0ABP5PPG4_9ACTN
MTQSTDFHAPAGLRTRGTVIVVPGRGETRATYARFGARLAADAYRVRVVDLPDGDPSEAEPFLDALARRLSEAVEGVAGEGADGLPRPLVLAGADLGAAALAALLAKASATATPTSGAAAGLASGTVAGSVAGAASGSAAGSVAGASSGPASGAAVGWWPEAVVLAGLPGSGSRAGGGWEDELDVRTHCPTHRGVLTGDASVRRGALSGAVPQDLLTTAYESTATIPHLLLVGDADPLADRDAITRTAKTLPKARLAVVRGAHHDVLNDLQHRAVAAEVVTFLETLRDDLVPAVTVETSAW